MPPATLAFLVILLVGLVVWVAALVCHLRARRHYVGPTGFFASVLPIARLRPSNYSAAGASLVRWELRCMLAFLCLIAIDFVIAHSQFTRLPQ
jgi:hypothetical protein